MRFYPRRLSQIGLRPGVALAIPLMLGWLVAYWQLSGMAPELVGVSRPGIRGLYHYLRSDYTAAARAYREAIRTGWVGEDSDDTAGYWALLAADLDTAERRARATLLRRPEAVEPLITLGEIALERGRIPEAVDHLQNARRRRPDDPDTLYLLAAAIVRAGDIEAGIEALNRGLRSGSAGDRETVLIRIMELTGELTARPEPTRPLCLLAHLHRYLRIFDLSQATVAEAYARRAIAARDHTADAYLTLGVLLDKRGRYDDALAAFQAAVAAAPRHAEALRWTAVEARNQANLLLEYRMITAAFDAAPTDPYYLPHLEHVVVKRLGDLRGMADLMERAVTLEETNLAAHEQLSRVAAELGDSERALRHRQRAEALRQASREDPDS